MKKSEELLLEILKRFKANGLAQVSGLNAFGYVRETPKSVYVTREKGKDTLISHKRLLMGIEAYQSNPSLYEQGPAALREFGITHVTSPIYAMLHLLSKKEFTN
ncbi:MAG: hypothetical protein LCH37_13200 [Bacteroidetes bacterium]|nr:hypothetical protein [Bacteroidota bacterium]MCK6612025.1 hypothetical protein [Bacteroidia bacterium]